MTSDQGPLIRMCWAGLTGQGGSSQKYYLFIPCLDPGDCSTSTRNILMLTILYSLSGENSRERTFFFLSKQKLFIYFNAGVQNGPTLFIPCFLSTMSALLSSKTPALSHSLHILYVYKCGKIMCLVCLKAPRGIKMDLQIKVGWVLKNSGNSLSDGHRKFSIWTIGCWEICN